MKNFGMPIGMLRLWVLLCAVALGAACQARAAEFVVSNTSDAGAGSLRQAILDANTQGGADSVIFSLPGAAPYTITLTSGQLTITDSLSISGPGASGLAVVRAGSASSFRLLTVSAGTVTISGLTLSNGDASGSQGGGIYQTGGSLSLDGMVVSNNKGAVGGGILREGSGTLSLFNSTFSGNTAVEGAGGLLNSDGSGSTSVVNCTFSGNNAPMDAAIGNFGTLSLRFSTIAGNSATSSVGGINNHSGTFSIANTIVALNTAPSIPDAKGAFASGGYNLIGVGGAGGFNKPGDQASSNTPLDPLLGPLQSNGGPTPTRALLTGSPALDAGLSSQGPARDQRGQARPNDFASVANAAGGDGSDIGAFERQASDAAADPPPLIVTRRDDVSDANDGQTTLREAIANASTYSGTPEITFSSAAFSLPAPQGGYTVALTQGELVITRSLDIVGPGASLLNISGGGASRVLRVGNDPFSNTLPQVRISGLHITRGNGSLGGGVLVGGGGSLSLTRCLLSQNRLSQSGDGTDSGIGGGAAVYQSSSLTLDHCTLSNNAASGGGALRVLSGSATLSFCTITGNRANIGGGIISDATTRLSNTIVAGNTTNTQSPDAYSSKTAAFVSSGYNLIGVGDGSTGFTAAGDQVGTAALPLNARLGPLANNGGTSSTYALLTGSPAINAANPSVTSSTSTYDQRGAGFPRVRNGRADIGAFEADFTPAESLVVTTAQDEDNGTSDASIGRGTSLREAMTWANRDGIDSAITFDATAFALKKVITIPQGDLPAVTSSVSVAGPTAPGAGVTIQTSTIQGGSVFSVSNGGSATISSLTLRDASAAVGTGSGGRATVANCTITGTSYGISTGNGGQTTVRNCTITGNTSGISNNIDGQTTVRNCTITRNADGIFIAGVLSLSNSIAVGNIQDINRYGTLSNEGYNIIGGTEAEAGINPNDLRDNGGPTATFALLPGSPAVNAGDPAATGSASTYDQRGAGFERVKRGRLDIGAFEVQNAAPSARGVQKAVEEDSSLLFSQSDATSGYADAEGDPLVKIQVTSLPQHGTLKLGQAPVALNQEVALADVGSLIYSPQPNFSGADSIGFTVADLYGYAAPLASGAFEITVAPVNDAPTLDAITDLSLDEDAAAQTVEMSGISAGGESQALTITASSDNTALISDPTIVYTSPETSGQLSLAPVANASGTATITVTVSDDGGTDRGGVNSISRTFTVTVASVNDAPSFTLSGDPPAVDEDASPQVLAGFATNISPGPGPGEIAQAVTFSITGNTNAALFSSFPSLAPDGTLRYTPAPNANGTATITVTLSDDGPDNAPNQNTSGAQSFIITVAARNDAPIANDDTLAVAEDSAATQVDVLSNDSSGADVGETLTVSTVDQPTHGAVILAAGVVRYQPAPNFFGVDSFGYTLSDGNGGTATARVRVTVAPVNDAPQAQDQALSTPEDTPLAITLGASDVDSTSFTYSIVSGPLHGTLGGSGAARTYTPAANFEGSDAFTFKANDGAAESNVATIHLTVVGSNDAPLAVADTASTEEDTPVAISVLANDRDEDTPASGLSVASVAVTAATHGTVIIADDRKSVRFVPDPNFNGRASFRYTVSDGALTSSAAVDVEVRAVNDAPVAQNQSLQVLEDTPLAIALAASDIDSADLNFTIVNGPQHGTLTGSGAALTYTPSANYNGPDAFSFKASDGVLSSEAASVTLQVLAQDDAPSARDNAYTVAGLAPLSVAAPGVLANDEDADGDTLRALLVAAPQHGALSFDASGSFLYTPATGFNGTDTFTYRAADAASQSQVATVTLNVGGNPARALSLTLSASTVREGGSVTGTIALSRPAASNIVVALSSTSPAAAAVPDQVQVLAGQVSASFPIKAPRNTLATGAISTVISAGAGDYGTASAKLTVSDIESPALALSVSPTALNDNFGPAAAVGLVSRNTPTSTSLTVRLSSSDLTEARVPAAVVIPAGARSATFLVAAVDDRVVDARQIVRLTASATSFRAATATITVGDNGRVTRDLRLALENNGRYAERVGGQVAQGSVSLPGTPLPRPLSITLVSSDPARILLPRVVVLPAGKSTVVFSFRVLDNQVAESDAARVWVTARSAGYGTSALQAFIQDNDGPSLTLSLPRPSVSEASGSLLATLTRRNTPVNASTQALVVGLASSDRNRVTVPATVTIPQGKASVTFAVSLINNRVADGTRRVTLTASKPSFTPGTATLDVLDDDAPRQAAMPGASAAPAFSTATASTSEGLKLRFWVALDEASAQDALNYQVLVNGQAVKPEITAYHSAARTVTLILTEGALHPGDSVEVRWQGLYDTQGHELSGVAGPLSAL